MVSQARRLAPLRLLRLGLKYLLLDQRAGVFNRRFPLPAPHGLLFLLQQIHRLRVRQGTTLLKAQPKPQSLKLLVLPRRLLLLPWPSYRSQVPSSKHSKMMRRLTMSQGKWVK